MDTLPGAIGLLAGAVSYMLGVCAPIGPGEMALPTPCPHWDLARLLSHLCESMADLEAALRTGRLDLNGPPGRTGGLVACTGAVEIAVHGWDVSSARARAGRGGGFREAPIPAALATRMLRLGPLLVAGREGLFGVPVEVPAQASPGDRLVGYLGRHPGAGS
jgi:hypothetical protein